MAVHTGVSGNSLSATTNLPSGSLFTIKGKFRLNSDRNANVGFFALGQSGYAGVWMYCGTRGDGTTLEIGTGDGGDTGSTALNVGQWYDIAVTYDGTNYKMYLDGELDVVHAYGTGVTVSLLIFNSGLGNEWLDGDSFGYIVYDGLAFTQPEIRAQMRQIAPIRRDHLNRFIPVLPNSGERGRDWSGNGYNLTENGTMTDVASLGIPWQLDTESDELWQGFTAAGGGAVVDSRDRTALRGVLRGAA